MFVRPFMTLYVSAGQPVMQKARAGGVYSEWCSGLTALSVFRVEPEAPS